MTVFNRPDQPLIDAFGRAGSIRERAAAIKTWAETPFRFVAENGALCEMTVGVSRALTLFARWADGEEDILFEAQDHYRAQLIVPMNHVDLPGDWNLVLVASNVPGLTDKAQWELRKECGFTGVSTVLGTALLGDEEDAVAWGEMVAVAAGFDLTAALAPVQTVDAFATLVA
jgi:hypothetical protein